MAHGLVWKDPSGLLGDPVVRVRLIRQPCEVALTLFRKRSEAGDRGALELIQRRLPQGASGVTSYFPETASLI